jgi:transcriptional regulator with XRE-family HTH domain
LNFELFKARKEAKLTHQDIENLTGIKRDRYGRIERNVSEPSVNEAMLIAEVVEKDVVKIFLPHREKNLLNEEATTSEQKIA